MKYDPELSPRHDLTLPTIPAAFVLLWSSGLIAAKIGLGYADTLTFLGLRYGVVTLLMGGVAFAMGVAWPGRKLGLKSAISPLLAYCFRRFTSAASGWPWAWGSAPV